MRWAVVRATQGLRREKESLGPPFADSRPHGFANKPYGGAGFDIEWSCYSHVDVTIRVRRNYRKSRRGAASSGSANGFAAPSAENKDRAGSRSQGGGGGRDARRDRVGAFP